MRPDGRSFTDLRPVSITAGLNPYAEGSALCSFGHTEVLCVASIEDGVPAFLADSDRGWVTAEYAMLPRSTYIRTSRSQNQGGRAKEISRLIGRSLRAAVDLKALKGHTIRIDCDVLVADGGTRCAAITGGYVALAYALKMLNVKPLRQVAAVSLGRVQDRMLLDLCYEEDSSAQVDLAIVMAPGEELLEVQATAEDGWFLPKELASMLQVGIKAGETIFAAQNNALAALGL